MEYYPTLKKEENSAICYNMNKPRRHFAREKKLVIQGQILYDVTYVESKKQNKTHREQIGGCQRQGMRGKAK